MFTLFLDFLFSIIFLGAHFHWANLIPRYCLLVSFTSHICGLVYWFQRSKSPSLTLSFEITVLLKLKNMFNFFFFEALCFQVHTIWKPLDLSHYFPKHWILVASWLLVFHIFFLGLQKYFTLLICGKKVGFCFVCNKVSWNFLSLKVLDSY